MEERDSNDWQLQRYKMTIAQYNKPRRNINTRGWSLLLLRRVVVNISTIRKTLNKSAFCEKS